MYCKKCGHKNEDGARFCTKCGEAMEIVTEAVNLNEKSKGRKKAAVFIIPFVLVIVAVVHFVMQPRYELVVGYNGYGLAKAEWKEKYGYIDEKRHAVIPVKFDDVSLVDSFGLVMVEKDGYSGIYDIKGREILPVAYNDILKSMDYSEDDLRWIEYDGQVMFLDRENNAAYDAVNESEIENYFIVKNNKKYGCVSELGEVILNCEFDELELLDSSFGILKVKIDGQINFVTPDGEILYDSVEEANEQGWALVKKGENYGCVDEDGSEIIPVLYKEIILGAQQDNGYYPVSLDQKQNFLDEYGQLVYETIGEYSANGLAVVSDDQGWYGYANELGENVIPCYYEEAKAFGDANLARIKNGKKWGFINKLGVCVIAPKYDNVDEFNDLGYAFVQNGKLYNFVSESGIESFEYVSEFADNAAIAKQDRKYGLVGKDGVLLTENWYDHIYEDTEFLEVGLFRARKNGKYTVLNDQGQEISVYYDGIDRYLHNGRIVCWKDNRYQVLDQAGCEILEEALFELEVDDYAGAIISTNEDGKVGAYDSEGKRVFQNEYNSISIIPCKEPGDYCYMVYKDKKYGIYSMKGEMIFPIEFDLILSYYLESSKGDEEDCVYYSVLKDGKYALADAKGKMLTSFLYDHIYIHNNSSIVQCNEKWGVIDTKGNMILECKYNDVKIMEAESECYIVANDQGKYGCVNKDGEVVIPMQYDDLSYDDGVLIATIEDKRGVINEEGEWLIRAEYDNICQISVGDIRYYRVELDEKKGILDQSGITILPTIYDGIDWIYPDEDGEDFVTIRYDELSGVINQNYEIVISPEYSDILIYDSYDYVCRCKAEDGKYSLIDKQGNVLISEADWISGIGTGGLVMVDWSDGDSKYDIYNYRGEYVVSVDGERAGMFGCGLACIKKDGLWGYINTKGEVVIECMYDDAEMFSSDGIARVRLGDKWGYIDEQGNAITDCIYPYAEDFYNGYGEVSEVGEESGIGYISASGQIAVPLEYDSGNYYEYFRMDLGDMEVKYNRAGNVIS